VQRERHHVAVQLADLGAAGVLRQVRALLVDALDQLVVEDGRVAVVPDSHRTVEVGLALELARVLGAGTRVDTDLVHLERPLDTVALDGLRRRARVIVLVR